MARKDVALKKISSAQSLATSFISEPTVIRYLDNCAYQINASAGATGTFQVEASLDYKVNEPNNVVSNAGNWAALDLTGTPALIGSADTIIIDLNQLPFNAIRLRYIATNGTGTADIYVMVRQLGG